MKKLISKYLNKIKTYKNGVPKWLYYTTWKVDYATPMYWFIMAPYLATCWELCHIWSKKSE